MTQQARDPDSWTPWRARITETAMLTETERFFRLEPIDGQALGQVPGQFVQVCLPGIGEAPISVASAPNEEGTFDLVVRKVGNLTEALHRTVEGQSVGIRGPFGRGFPVDSCRGRDLVIIAGGIGLVPLRSLIQHGLMHRNRFKSFSVLYGAKRPAEMLFKEELIAWQGRPDTDFHITVDVAPSGYLGHVGLITTLIPYLEGSPADTSAIVVGPPVMFRFVLRELLAHGVPEDHIWASLERHMKCGIGQCGHCQINGALTCREGPVFSAQELSRLPEAI